MTTEQKNEFLGNILVIDDDRAALRVIDQLLTEQGYNVRPVLNPQLALSSAQLEPPDLILLDIIMQSLDGYEVCKALKADERTRDIPIIFISGLGEEKNKLRGFEVGGVDYITKPFRSEETLARVETHLALYQLQREQKERNVRLQKEIAERTRVEAELQQVNEALEARVAELATLNRITQKLSATLDFQTLLDSITPELAKLFAAEICGIMLLNPERTVLTVMAMTEHIETAAPHIIGEDLPLTQSPFSAQVIETCKPTVTSRTQMDMNIGHSRRIVEERDVQQVMVLPLLSRGQAIGTICVATVQADREFTSAEVQLAETVAGQLAGAIDNARLFMREQRQKEMAESLREVAQVLNSSLDRDVVLLRIVEQLGRVVEYSSAGIFLRDEDDLVVHEGIAIPDTLIGKRIPLSADNPTVRVFKRQKVTAITDVQDDANWKLWSDMTWIHGWMGAPLVVEGEALGVITVDNEQVGAYDEVDTTILRIFADQAALALKNAQLYEQTRRDAKTKATLLNEVNHRVKNNLSAIIGLLYMEQRYPRRQEPDPCRAFIKDMINRIQGLATVHSLLSASEWKPILLKHLVERIIGVSLQTLPFGKRVSVEVSPSPIRVNAPQANKLALLINELITNSIKHALRDREVASIRVNISCEDDEVLIEFRDDGPGYPPNISDIENHSVGMYLIQTIVNKDLGGSLMMSNDNGAVTAFRFRLWKEEG